MKPKIMTETKRIKQGNQNTAEQVTEAEFFKHASYSMSQSYVKLFLHQIHSSTKARAEVCLSARLCKNYQDEFHETL